MRPGLARSLLLASAILTARAASADVSQTDRSLAQTLFEQGKELMQQGRHAEACPKLQESQRLDPGGGTMLNLALCHEQEGKLSTAWADFNEALSLARRDGRPEREQAALEHIAALEPRLPRLTLSVESVAKDEALTLDGVTVGAAAWGSPMSVDPGPHVVEASAPGRETWHHRVSIAIAEQKRVVVPELDTNAAPAAAKSGATAATIPAPRTPSSATAPAADAGRSSGGGPPTAAWIVGGTGVVLVAVGAAFGVQAMSKRQDSNSACPANRCTAEGVRLNDQAKTAAWIADFGVGIGVVGIGVGTYLLLSGESPTESAATTAVAGRLSLDAKVLPSGGAVSVGGAW